MTATFTRTHVLITFANPHLVCETCHQPAPRWHNPDRCGCGGVGWTNDPCGHQAGIVSVCLSWGPVDGCRCPEDLGEPRHAPRP